MIDFEILDQTAGWFKEAVPSPTSKNQHTQLGCHFEEVAEMIAELSSTSQPTQDLLTKAKDALSALAFHLKVYNKVVTISDPHNMLKELCDQIVTATGIGHMYHYSMVEAMEEVNESNWSKFVQGRPIFDENQKIIKGPDYFKADLTPFIPSAPVTG